MPRYSKDHVPKYRLHKQSGQAIVTLDGKDHLLGKHDTAESRAAYNQLISKWFAAGRDMTAMTVGFAVQTAAGGPTIDEVVAAFWMHAQSYYRGRDGKPTKELNNFKDVLKPLRRMFGPTLAERFGAKSLKLLREEMIRIGLARKTINRRTGRIRSVFAWAVADELVPSTVLVSLQAVKGIQEGRSDARETDQIKPVEESHVRAVMASANRYVSAMLELQLITGMRSGELVILRTGDIDRTGKVWKYSPEWHKNEHRGQDRVVYLGAKAQAVLLPFLSLNPEKYVFSPADAEAERKAVLTANRKTPLSCGNRVGTNRKTAPKRKPGDRYTTGSYAYAVARACVRAFPAPNGMAPEAADAWRDEHHFHPHQLRHTAATRFRRESGVEVARVMLGQKSIDSTLIYAEADMQRAEEIASQVG